MRMKSLSLCVLLAVSTPLAAQVSINIGLPGVSIGLNLGGYPDLAPIPGYPVYYAPRTDGNLFFYDGLYWVFSQDGWYSSAWYNGPWQALVIDAVPLFLLRVPVRYYRQPPIYFHGWREDAPPRWGERWGQAWEQRHRNWDHWDNRQAPRAAPLPLYQREYTGDRYPQGERQRELRARHYDYQPREDTVRQVYQRPVPVVAPPQGDDRDERNTQGRQPRMEQRGERAPQTREAAPTRGDVRESRPQFSQPAITRPSPEPAPRGTPTSPRGEAPREAMKVQQGRQPTREREPQHVPAATRETREQPRANPEHRNDNKDKNDKDGERGNRGQH